nr:EOG090X04WU [Eulimnadia texana]
MKVKVLSRNPDDYLRETKKDIHKVPRNYDPSLHPLETPREYTRALNAVKLERVFAKPFVCNLDGHRDGVSCLAKTSNHLSWLYSGSCDGEMRLWDLSRKKLLHSVQAHDGYVRGIAFGENSSLFTVGDDKLIKHLYTFDMRRLGFPLNMHKDHVSAVIDVDYSPTGKEIVSGSYDKTIRIFEVDKLKEREKMALNVNAKLKEKFGNHPEVKRIARHRHVPKHVYNARNELQASRQSQKRK